MYCAILTFMESTPLPQPVPTPVIPVRVLADLVCPDYPIIADVIRNLPDDVLLTINMMVGRAYEAGFSRAVFCARADEEGLGESIQIHHFIETLESFTDDVPGWAYSEGFEWDDPCFEDTPEWWAEHIWSNIR
jgi:hypothetical protein